MFMLRKTQTLCPECVKDVDGAVVVDAGRAYLSRECPEHGVYRYLLSQHGDDYASLDRFYMALKKDRPQGRQSLLWIAASARCQQNCPYCSADVQRGTFQDMTWEEILDVLNRFPGRKVCFSGGEPTLHPNILDFFREMKRRKSPAILATNGLKLASKQFCRELKDAGLTEARISVESLHRNETETLGMQQHVDAKLQAIENLGELGVVVNISPTLLKGVNEKQLVEVLEFAKERPYVREVQATGFAWVGSGVGLPQERMISADEMMDIVFEHYCTCQRKDLFTFAKLVMALTQIVELRYCLNSQAMIFVRDKRSNRLRPLVEYFNMSNMERLLEWWIRRAPDNRLLRGLTFVPVLAGSLSLRSAAVVLPLFRLLVANLVHVNIRRYPASLLVVTFNTNCCTPNAETAVRIQCISHIVYKQQGEVRGQNVADLFPEKERASQKSGERDQLRAGVVPEGAKSVKETASRR